MTGRYFRKYLHWWVICLLSIAYLTLQYNHFFNILNWTDTDDALQYELSKNITAGDWLGGYGRLTLIKGVGFPLWGAFLHASHIPLWLGNSILTIVACLALVYALRRLVASRWVLVAVYGLVLFNPMVTTRVYRDTIIPAITILVCAWAIGTFVCITNWRAGKSKLRTKDLFIFTAIGIVGLPMWYYTREDSIWLMPFAYGLIAIALSYSLYLSRKNIKKYIGILVLVLVLSALPFLAVNIAGNHIAKLNQKHYGRYIINDYFSKDFEHAYATLNRVEPAKPKILSVPISKEMRKDIYAVSPAFKSLEKCLDTKDGVCTGFTLTGPNKSVKDYEGGWFPFAIRLAVQEAGYYDSATEASNYYTQLTKEVDTACSTGALKCHPTRMVSFMPLPSGPIISGFIPNAGRAVAFLLPLHYGMEEKNFYPVGAKQSPYSDEIAKYYGVRYTIPELGLLGQVRESAQTTVHKTYQLVSPVLACVSILGLIAATILAFRRRIQLDLRLLVILWLLLATIVLRVSMLAYVHTVSFVTTFPLYYASVYPLLFLFEGLSIVLIISIYRLYLRHAKG